MALNITWEAYPTPNVTAGMGNMTQYVNVVTEGYFGIGLLLTLWVIMFMSFRRWGDTEAFAAANFITTVLAGMLRGLNILSDMWFVIFIMLSGISLLLMIRRSG